MVTSSERRLHPLSILFSAGGHVLRLALPIAVLVLASAPDSGGVVIVAMYLGPVAALIFIAAAVHWMRYTYRYDERDLVVKSGLLTRNERRIPYTRIQNLDASQSPLQRLTGVVAVFVQTGGGEEPEASLRVLPLAALTEMRERVIAAGGRAERQPTATDASDDEPVEPGDGDVAARVGRDEQGPEMRTQTLLELAPRELILAGFIENRGMVVIAGALALLEQAGILERAVERLSTSDSAVLTGAAGQWIGSAQANAVRGAILVIAALLMILLVIRLLSTLWALVRLYDFRLQRTGDDLHTTYGLFTRVSATIPLHRVQTVVVREGVLHRALGRLTVSVETAGGTLATTGAPQREPIAPIVREALLPALLNVLQPGLTLSNVDWRPVHPRAFGRILRGALFWPLVLSAGAWLAVGPSALGVLAALLLLAFMYARLRVRSLGWSLTDDAIITRDGAFMRTTRVARFNRVQVAALARSPLDLRTGMARVRADTAGAHAGVVVPYLGLDTAERLHGELAARTAATPFTW